MKNRGFATTVKLVKLGFTHTCGVLLCFCKTKRPIKTGNTHISNEQPCFLSQKGPKFNATGGMRGGLCFSSCILAGEKQWFGVLEVVCVFRVLKILRTRKKNKRPIKTGNAHLSNEKQWFCYSRETRETRFYTYLWRFIVFL